METDRVARQTGVMRRPAHTVQWVLSLIVVGVVAGALVLVAARVSLPRISNNASDLANRSLPANEALQTTSSATAAGQTALLEALTGTDAVQRGAAIGRAQQASRQVDSAWANYVRLAGASPEERRLQRQYKATHDRSAALAVALIAASPNDPSWAANLAAERASSAREIANLDQLQARLYKPAARARARAVVAGVSDAGHNVLVASAVAFLFFLGIGAVILRRALRFERTEAGRARAQSIAAHLADVETRLQRALEMESTEEGTYEVIRQALEIVAPGQAVELLVADSSRAHFHQVLSTGDGAACRVGAPTECPAANSGQTRVFDDSANLGTCPYLRDHGERVWATCVPVSIAGRTTGVLHAQNSIDAPPDDTLADELELVARKAGDRMGVLRVLARTEAQAQVDALTGLPNRRTLEQRTHDLLKADMPFVVAFADLDHFKDLNDLYGHETGDRALRLFARVLRDSVRPHDIPARYGGEEFVVVLPDCSVVDARVVAERIRSQLGAALTSGMVPSFSVSVGLAAAQPGEAISEVIDRADSALLKAKQLGRDRVVAAGELFEPDAHGSAPTALLH